MGSEVATALPGSTVADMMLSPNAKSSGIPCDGSNANDSRGHLAWLPETASSVALRLLALDAAIFYRNDECGRDIMAEYRATQRPFPGAVTGTVESMYCINGGHVDAAFFAPYPWRLSFAPRQDFVFPVDQFKEDIASGSDAPVKSMNHTVLAAVHPARGGRGGRGGRGTGRGGRGRGRRRAD